jgi:integrase
MSLKGTITTTDYVEFKPTLRTFKELIKRGNIFGLYGVVALHTGLRVGDILKITFEDLKKNEFTILEGKTKKRRTITVHSEIKEALKYFNGVGLVFISQKNSVFTVQQINRKLKKLLSNNIGLNISSHSLRKSFGRQVYNNNNKTEDSLIMLNEIFNHSCMSITRKYIGIRKEEIANVYLNL